MSGAGSPFVCAGLGGSSIQMAGSLWLWVLVALVGSSWTGVAPGLLADTPCLVWQAQPEGCDFLLLPTKVTCSLHWPFEPRDLGLPTVLLSPHSCPGLAPHQEVHRESCIGPMNLTHRRSENQLPALPLLSSLARGRGSRARRERVCDCGGGVVRCGYRLRGWTRPSRPLCCVL